MCAEISFYLRLNTKVAFKNVIIDRHCSFKSCTLILSISIKVSNCFKLGRGAFVFVEIICK